MSHTVYDLEFLSRIMGSPARLAREPGDGGLNDADLRKWVSAAWNNDAKRGQVPGRIAVLQEALAEMEATAASTPVEEPKRTLDVVYRCPQDGLCVCESGKAFRDCHGGET